MGEGNYLTLEDVLPDPPEIAEELLERCRASKDYRPILFEYYRSTAMLVVISSSLLFESPDWNGGSRRLWTVLVGLLKRTERLMAAHLEFFQDDRYGDTTFILDRCLLETCVKIRWIAGDASEKNLRRYFEDSIFSDKELLREIEKNIGERGGIPNAIEARMLRSIQKNLDGAGISRNDIDSVRRAPSLAAMLEQIGEKRFIYAVIGKIGSHAVHGSWANLLQSYLVEDDQGNFVPATDFPPSHINQYVINCLFVLDACGDFVGACFNDGPETTYFREVLVSYSKEIWDLYSEIVDGDFDLTPDA